MIDIKRAPKIEPTRTDEETNEDVYLVHRTYGSLEFRVPAGTEVRQQDARWHDRYISTDPRYHLPNLEVREGVLVIPFSDLVEEIVRRSDPAELAQELWAVDKVREAFVEAMSWSYSQMNVNDADRRAVLLAVAGAVHSSALDKLTNVMNDLESRAREGRQSGYIHDMFNQFWRNTWVVCNETLGEAWVALSKRQNWREDMWQRSRQDHEDFAVTGRHWNEARDFWRRETLRQFPMPVEEAASSAERDNVDI